MRALKSKFSPCAIGLLVSLWMCTVAHSISITNRDEKDHKITIIEGEAKIDHAMKPTSVIEGICLKGCIVRLNDSEDDEYELEGTEVVSIEDGYLYYDGPDAPAEATPGEAAKPKLQ